MIYWGAIGAYDWDGCWQIAGSVLILVVDKSGLTGLSAAVTSLIVLATKGVAQKMPLFDYGRTAREEKIRQEARREALKEGARRMAQERDAWDAKKANGSPDAPKPTEDSIAYP